MENRSSKKVERQERKDKKEDIVNLTTEMGKIYLKQHWEDLLGENYLLDKMRALKEEDKSKGKTLLQEARLLKAKNKEDLGEANSGP